MLESGPQTNRVGKNICLEVVFWLLKDKGHRWTKKGNINIDVNLQVNIILQILQYY